MSARRAGWLAVLLALAPVAAAAQVSAPEPAPLEAAPNDAAGYTPPAEQQSPLTVTADWVYVRLHGPDPQAYHGSYTPEALAAWAERIAEWTKAGLDVYCFFDNDVNAAAPGDAKALQALVDDRLAVSRPH